MAGCTVKQEFASDSKTATSLGSKTHLEKYIKTQLLCYCAIFYFALLSKCQQNLQAELFSQM